MASNYDVGNIELNIKSTATESIKSLDQMIAKAKEFQKSLPKVSNDLKKVSSNAKKMGNNFKEPKRDVKELEKETAKLGKTSDKTGSSLKDALKIGGGLYLGRKALGFMRETINESAELIQNYRLLQVSSKEYFDQSLDFQSKITDSFGINISDAMGVQAYFGTLTSSLGIANEASNQMSETLTKLTYDLGSLFGEDFESMYTKLQSGLVGQTKPLRGLGIDVTQQTIQGYLDNMGFNLMVHDLTQAEKTLLRYIAIVDQGQLAHGHLAQSINMPSQQIQILKSQLKELGLWLGNVFINTIGRILPYINGFIMALKEMVKVLATLFGFDLGDYSMGDFSTPTAGVGNVQDGIDGVGSSADKASGKIKKMKGLLGFDEIHNIQEPPEQSGAGGVGGGGAGGIAGGIYDDLIDQLKGYDNLMGDVRSKANDIRDTLLEWLGFQEDMNGNWEWGGFREMATSAKLLSVAAGALIGYKLWKWVDKVAYAFFNTRLGGEVGLLAMKLWEVGAAGRATSGLGVLGSTASKILTPIVGLAGAAGLVYTNIKSWKFGKQIAQGKSLSDVTKDMAKNTGLAAVSGAALGFAIGGLPGAAIGAVASGLFAIGTAVGGWLFADPIEDVEKFGEVSDETRKKLEPFQSAYEDLDNVIKRSTWSDEIITEEKVEEIGTHLEKIKGYLDTEIVQGAEETKEKLSRKEIFEDLDPNARGELMKQIDEASKKQTSRTEELTSELEGIYAKAAKRNGKIKDDERKRINEIQDELYNHGITNLTKSEKEQDTIYRNIKDNSTRLNAEQASEIVKSANDAKKGTIKEAEDRYAEEMRIIEDLKERNVIDDDTYKKMKKSAEKSKKDTIREAEDKHDKIIGMAREHSGDMIGNIDWETGETLSKYEIMKNKVFGVFGDLWTGIQDGFKDLWDDHIKPWFSLDRWKIAANNAMDAALDAISAAVKNFLMPSLPPIGVSVSKLPKFKVTGSFGFMPPRVPRIEQYADGGFPDGENGLFFANDSEMVGKFTNGKTAVANNDQIVSGITRGVYKGVRDAIGTQKGDNDKDIIVNVNLDGRDIAKQMNKRRVETDMIRG